VGFQEENPMNKPTQEPRNAPPVHEVRIGLIKAAIWANKTDDGVRHNVTFERSYRDGEEWKTTSSFGRDDLLVLAKVADLAHTWILQPEKPAPKPDLTRNRLPKAA
jgi:hypothetical protein